MALHRHAGCDWGDVGKEDWLCVVKEFWTKDGLS
jgi:hypothetical protein